MTYINLINAFEKWLETNYLQSSAQLLWYKLIALFNKAGWSEWVTVDNHRLMSMMQMNSEKTLIRCRDKLIESKLLDYQKGTKSKPNRYRINTVNFTVENKSTVKNTVDMTVDVGVDMGVDVSNINRLRQDKDIYINLYNKYKARIESESAYQKHKIISECKNCKEYALLNMEEQEKLFLALMSIDKRIKK